MNLLLSGSLWDGLIADAYKDIILFKFFDSAFNSSVACEAIKKCYNING